MLQFVEHQRPRRGQFLGLPLLARQRRQGQFQDMQQGEIRPDDDQIEKERQSACAVKLERAPGVDEEIKRRHPAQCRQHHRRSCIEDEMRHHDDGKEGQKRKTRGKVGIKRETQSQCQRKGCPDKPRLIQFGVRFSAPPVQSRQHCRPLSPSAK